MQSHRSPVDLIGAVRMHRALLRLIGRMRWRGAPVDWTGWALAVAQGPSGFAYSCCALWNGMVSGGCTGGRRLPAVTGQLRPTVG